MTGRPTRATALSVLLGLLALLPLAGCGEGGDGDGERTLTVYAAASLTEPFEQLAEQFAATHDGVDVELSLGGSADLVTQLQEGARADVLATADTATMDRLVADGLAAGEPRTFATNTLEIAVPAGNPAGVRSLEDLDGDRGLDLVVCAPEVPCGAAALALAELGGVTLAPVSEEQSVTDVLAKVAAGEADAGLVYVTDVATAGDDVEGIAVPEAAEVINDYPVVALADSDEPALAEEFVDLVLGDTGRAALAAAGFGGPR
ncbi:molybdate ABC transporter substrate-binding protein [Nocardioides dongkuii]|uniref:molybdate ABC transporter substrate-binding protein n=1 Tax=Nocardioides dongkuii TaxID=2760089 RepID=UPI0015FE3B1D|nr:molybdate ABC transporter substrate-binding protein [Nocardioides dongkuii]